MIRPLALLLLLLLAPAPAPAAACGGSDLMAALARDDPAAHAAILARAARVPNGEGRLWRVRAPDGARSHLFGTLHSTEAAARGLPGQAAAALDAARVLLVETTPTEQARLEARIAGDPGFLMGAGPPLSARLPGGLRPLAERALAERGVSMAVADRLKPWFLLAMLAIPECEREAIAGGAMVLDQAIAARAARSGIPVAGLETAEDSIAAFERLPAEAATRLLIDAVAAARTEEDLRRTLEVLWAEGRIAAITEFTIWHSERQAAIGDSRAAAEDLDTALLAARNRAWIDRIAREARRGGAFVAVGALHLVGEEGLVALLRARGFEVARVPLP